MDTYLTHVSLYWFTRTGVSSARHYYEDAHSGAGYRDVQNKVPTAVAVFPQDFRTIRTFAEPVAKPLESGRFFTVAEVGT